MIDLAGFLLARLAEDEAVVRAAASQPWNFYSDGQYGAVAEFLQRWNPINPARVLAEVAAKRRIVEECTDTFELNSGAAVNSEAVWLAEAVLKVLAQPYADHPDFDPAWKVEP